MKSLKKFLALFLSLALCLSMFVGCGSKADEATEDPSEAPSGSEGASVEVLGDAASLGIPANMGSAYGENAPTILSSYGVTDVVPQDATMTAVVAVDKDGNPILTNAQLQFFFWEEFYQMQEQYGEYYMSMLGMDTTKPLSQQASLMENYTWEQYFLEALTTTFSNFYALASAATAAGFALPEKDLETLDYYTSTDGDFVQDIINAGYESLEDYLHSFYGPGVDMEDYRTYLENYLLAMAYYNDVLYIPVLEATTEADVEAYFDENAEKYEADGLAKANNVSVRHILIAPVGETDAETGEYSEEQWAAAEVEAQRVFDMWLENPTEDYFAELANDHSTDGGSNTTGGLYEDFAPGEMVAEFNDWSFDQTRSYGDHAIVKSPYGYHIMFFVEQTETRVWYDTVLNDIAGSAATAALEQAKKDFPVYFDYTQVRIVDVIALLPPATEEE